MSCSPRLWQQASSQQPQANLLQKQQALRHLQVQKALAPLSTLQPQVQVVAGMQALPSQKLPLQQVELVTQQAQAAQAQVPLQLAEKQLRILQKVAALL